MQSPAISVVQPSLSVNCLNPALFGREIHTWSPFGGLYGFHTCQPPDYISVCNRLPSERGIVVAGISPHAWDPFQSIMTLDNYNLTS